MPAPGDQHKPNGTTTTNPFEESKPHISEYTAQEIATLQSRLNKRLGPEFISTRPGPGNQKIAYLSAEKAINLANEVFGFNGWSTSIQNIQIDFVDENSQTGKVSLGLSVVVRVTLKDGTYHEDIGYGGIENCKGKAMAFEKSKKEATTDALKRALRNFGNVLGNCVYDKDYITKISKVKPGNGRFDVNELHRHPDFAPKVSEDVKLDVQNGAIASKTPSLGHEDSFDTSEFDDFDFNESELAHPDEILLPADPGLNQPPAAMRSGTTNLNTPSKAPQPRPQAVQAVHTRPPGQQSRSLSGTTAGPPARAGLPPNGLPQAMKGDVGYDEQHSSSPGMPSTHFAPHQGQGPAPTGSSMAPPAGFYTARAAKEIDQNNISSVPPSSIKFNPHAESPSIRKTAGVDHTKSVPVRREVQKADTNTPSNVLDPRGDQGRRVGTPGQPGPGATGRPGISTSAYRPPTRHGSPAVPVPPPNDTRPSADRVHTVAKRPPLSDLSNVPHSVTAITADGADAKRQRVGAGGAENAHNNGARTGA